MSKTYWVKKNPNCNKSEIEWIEINGINFYNLITSPQGKDRYFIDLEDYEIEATKSEYLKWRLEKNHSDYSIKQKLKHITISMYAVETEASCNLVDVIEDTSINIELDVEISLATEELNMALSMLTAEERWLIDEIFLSETTKTETAMSLLFGISQVAINKRKNKILKKLEFLVIKSQKSKQ